MNLSLEIARRYLVAKKSHNVINIISIVSVIGVMVGTMGLIIVLSVFNGFGNLVLSLYNSFDPDVRITSVYGKTFDPDSANIVSIKNIEGVKYVNVSLEENALVRYRDRQYIVTLKGVSDDFLNATNLQNKIVQGQLAIQKGDTNYAIVGGQIAYSLTLNLDDPFHSLGVFVPKRDVDASTLLDPSEAFASKNIYASGIFSIQQDFDSKYVVVPLRFARELIGQDKNISAIEIKLKDGVNETAATEKIKSLAGKNFEVKDRLQQHDFLYKILRSEKLAVFMILSFILLIATFNIIGSLTMLIIEKKKDIAILLSMGADVPMIKKIFLLEGLFISLSGAIAGLILGAFICFAQQTFGIIKLENAEAFIVDAYPVSMQAMDFVIVFITVIVIGFAAAWFTSSQLVKKQVPIGMQH